MLDREKQKNIVILRDCGFKFKDISIKLNIPYANVLYWYNKVKKDGLSNYVAGIDLTPAEVNIICYMLKKGIFKRDKIAKDLLISPDTVTTHKSNIYQKLAISGMNEFIWSYYNNKLDKRFMDFIKEILNEKD